MKRLIFFVILACGMAFGTVPTPDTANKCSSFPAGNTANCTFTATAGQFIAIYNRTSATGPFTITSSKGETVHQDHIITGQCYQTSGALNGEFVFAYITSAVGGSTTITSSTSSGSFYGLVVLPVTGADSSSPLDGCTSASGTSSGINSGNLTTTVNDELLLGLGDFADNNQDLVSQTAGYTLLVRNLASGSMADGFWYNSNTNTAGTYSFAPTLTGSTRMGVMIVGIKPAGGGTSVVQRHRGSIF